MAIDSNASRRTCMVQWVSERGYLVGGREYNSEFLSRGNGPFA